jgi:ABC-type transport system substrate-binding protein
MARPAGCEELLQKVLMEKDAKTRDTLTLQLVNLLSDDATFVPLYAEQAVAIMQKNLNDTGMYSFNHLIEWTPANAWMAK